MNKLDYMNLALIEAKKCQKTKDVPVGAVIVCNDKVIASAHNTREKTHRVSDHAEILAITKANKIKKDFRLEDCDIYITKEPCLMCMGAILSSRIRKIYYGAKDKRFGTEALAVDNNFNHKCEIEGGVLKTECEELIKSFFRSIR